MTGASGNVGTSVLAALARDEGVHEIVAIARRKPSLSYPKTVWETADVAAADLVPLFSARDI